MIFIGFAISSPIKKGGFVRKIGFVLVIIMQSGFAYGMQLSPCYTYGKTKIEVKKGSHYDVDGKIGCLVIEKNEQQLLYQHYADDWLVGDVKKLFCVSYRCFNDTGSDFNTADNFCVNNLLKGVYRKRLRSTCVEVVEPLVFKSQYTDEYYYYVEKICQEMSKHPCGVKYFGEEAIEQASDDLALCYNNVFSEGLKSLVNKKEKSIALPALGTAVGFPREKAVLVAVPEIMRFIKNNPNAYDRIELFVKEQSELELYQTLLNFYTNLDKFKEGNFE
jgi:hypothetical protein